jgi:hypothetical protein
MDLLTLLRNGITFGPFKTDYHQKLVGPEFQEAFFRQLARSVLPNLTLAFEEVKGSVTTHYDDVKYLGPISACKYKYRFDATFQQKARKEWVNFGFEYEPGPTGFQLRFDEPRITTARQFERIDEERREQAVERNREADALLVPGRSADRHWTACAEVWRRAESVLGETVGPLRSMPLPYLLCEKFAVLHPDSAPLLIRKMREPDAVLAAYAFMCWVRVAGPQKKDLPEDLFARTEPIRTHMGCFVTTEPLGKFFAGYWEEEAE